MLSDECSEALNKVIEDDKNSVEEMTKKFETIHNKVKFRCFGKVTLAAKKTKKQSAS